MDRYSDQIIYYHISKYNLTKFNKLEIIPEENLKESYEDAYKLIKKCIGAAESDEKKYLEIVFRMGCLS